MVQNTNNDALGFPDVQNLECSIDKLLNHSKNKSKFKKNPFFISTGGLDSSDYTGKSIKRSKFSQKHFQNTKFINSAAAGSDFGNCFFEECEFKNANFQECTFSNGSLINCSEKNSIINCNFNNSLFTNNFLLENLYFEHSVFQNTAFINGEIRDTTFYSSTLEDTLFSNVSFRNVFFNDLNIDYSVFQDIHMDNVILPFSQICFTFGLLPYLMNTKDNVYITSVANTNNRISIKEYLRLLPDFENYYLGTQDFFPLANIYLAKGELENARKAILSGVLLATTTFDFRQIKYLSKLIHNYSIFDFHQRKQIYDYIYKNITFETMHPGLLYRYNVYKNEIDCYLLDNNRRGIATCEIDILTEIYPDEHQKLGILISTLEEIIEQHGSHEGEHSILCRHNSAEEIVMKIQDIYEVLQVIIPTIYTTLLGVLVLEEKLINRHKNKVDMKYADEMKKLELEEKRINIEIAKKNLAERKSTNSTLGLEQTAIANFAENEKLRKNITDNNIIINNINYIIYGDIPSKSTN